MTGSGRRLGGVLLLVVGILAMHGLVSADHGSHGRAGASAPTSSVVSVARTGDAHAVAGHVGNAMARAVPTLPAAAGLSTRSLGSLPDVSATAIGLCLAVLLGVVLLRRADAGGWTTGPSPTAVAPAARTAPPGRGPPRRLLAELCVLRT